MANQNDDQNPRTAISGVPDLVMGEEERKSVEATVDRIMTAAGCVRVDNWIPSEHAPHENDIHEIIQNGILPFLLKQSGGEFTEADARDMADKAEARVRAFFDCFSYEPDTQQRRKGNSELMIALECLMQISTNFRIEPPKVAARRGPLIIVPG